jgi:hypothetical protein
MFDFIWKAAKSLLAILKIAEYIKKRAKSKHRPQNKE